MNLRKLISSAKDTSGDFIDLDVNSEWVQFQQKIDSSKKNSRNQLFIIRRILPYAAAACITGLCIFYFILNQKKNDLSPQSEILPTEFAIHKILIDGSTLDLSSNAIVDLSNFKNSAQRLILFEKGSGKFSVVKDSLHPFVVKVGHLKVTVLGTVFTINKTDSTITVNTYEGLVSVTTSSNVSKDIILINKGEFYTFFINEQSADIEVKETNASIITKVDQITNKQLTPASKLDKKVESGKRTYYLEHTIKFVQKKYQGKIKLAKRTKYDKKAKISVNLNAEFNTLVRSITDQSNLKARPGKCADCIELYIEKK